MQQTLQTIIVATLALMRTGHATGEDEPATCVGSDGTPCAAPTSCWLVVSSHNGDNIHRVQSMCYDYPRDLCEMVGGVFCAEPEEPEAPEICTNTDKWFDEPEAACDEWIEAHGCDTEWDDVCEGVAHPWGGGKLFRDVCGEQCGEHPVDPCGDCVEECAANGATDFCHGCIGQVCREQCDGMYGASEVQEYIDQGCREGDEDEKDEEAPELCQRTLEEGDSTCSEWVRSYGCAAEWDDVCKGTEHTWGEGAGHPWGGGGFRVRDGCRFECEHLGPALRLGGYRCGGEDEGYGEPFNQAYIPSGQTADGRTYYVGAEDRSAYLFFDPACGRGSEHNGEQEHGFFEHGPRWILSRPGSFDPTRDFNIGQDHTNGCQNDLSWEGEDESPPLGARVHRHQWCGSANGGERRIQLSIAEGECAEVVCEECPSDTHMWSDDGSCCGVCAEQLPKPECEDGDRKEDDEDSCCHYTCFGGQWMKECEDCGEPGLCQRTLEEGAVTCDEWVRTYGCDKKWGDVCKGLKIHPWGDCDFRVRDGCPGHCEEDPATAGPTDPNTGGNECPATMPIKCDDGTCHMTQADCPGNAGGPDDSAASTGPARRKLRG